MEFRNVGVKTKELLDRYIKEINDSKINFRMYEFKFEKYLRLRNLYLKVNRIENVSDKDSYGHYIKNLYLEDVSGKIYDCVYDLNYLVNYYNLQSDDIVEVFGGVDGSSLFAENITMVSSYTKLSNLDDFQNEKAPTLYINKSIKFNTNFGEKVKRCYIYCSYQDLEDKEKFLKVCKDLEDRDEEIFVDRVSIQSLLNNEYKLKIYEEPGEHSSLTREQLNLFIEDIHTWTNIQLNSNGELLKVKSSSYNKTKNKNSNYNPVRELFKNESKIYMLDITNSKMTFINTGYPRIRSGFQRSSKECNESLIKVLNNDLFKVLNKFYNKDINNLRFFVKKRMNPLLAFDNLEDNIILPDLRGNENYQMFLKLDINTHQYINDILYFENGTQSVTPYSYVRENSRLFNKRK